MFVELRKKLTPYRIKHLVFKRKCFMFFSSRKYANTFINEPLPVKIYNHRSLIRRKLGNVDMQLQENKASNLKLTCPKVNGIIIKPNEAFSFWRLVGECNEKKGYKLGLTINNDNIGEGIGGGMCQFTNLIHWLTLHSPLDITEYHHHDSFDLFPDFGRVVPFGCGTSIFYNYVDYQVTNNTDKTFQYLITTDDEYLIGELRCSEELEYKYHIKEVNAFFSKEEDCYYRNNDILREIVDKKSGKIIESKTIKHNHALVKYDANYIDEKLLKK